jgi:ribosomal protein L37AE/L43A
MGINRVQFQKGLSMAEFVEAYGSEVKCHEALVATRWPDGFVCPCCGGQAHSHFEREGRTYWQCGACRRQTTVTAGTVFEATKLPLTVWFLAMHLLTQAKNAVSALELSRHLGVRYKAAWLMKQKLMQVMQEREATRRLDGRVEIDDAYLGGERMGGKAGRGSENKVSFVAAVQTTEDGKAVVVRYDPIPFTRGAVETWSKTALAASAEVISDGLACFGGVTASGASHSYYVTSGKSGKAAAQHPAFRAVNTLLGNLKTALVGTYHAFAFRKYAHRYLADVQYRFNRRFDLKSILPRLVRAAAVTGPRPESRIRLAEVEG